MTENPPPNPDAQHSVTIALDEFAWSALSEEAGAMGLAVEELGAFAVLYYLADRDSGRTARRIPAQKLTGRKRSGAGPSLRVS